MTYKDAMALLDSLINYERTPDKSDYSIAPIVAALAALGDPQKNYPTVHIVGTNGKGSTAAFVESILRQHGLKTGLFTSPHICTVRERIRLNGSFITETDLARLIERLVPFVESRPLGIRTYFETLTAAAFLYFAENDVDVAIAEAGLGGRIDATNAGRSDIVVLTSLGYDHTHTLGDDIYSIASEKLGVIKVGESFVVYGDDEISDFIENTATSMGAISVPENPYNDGTIFLSHRAFTAHFSGGILDGKIVFDRAPIDGLVNVSIRPSLRGSLQLVNIQNALAAVYLFSQWVKPITLHSDALILGIERAFIPARLDIVSTKPLVLMDGGHNPTALQRTLEMLDTMRVSGDKSLANGLFVLFGAMRDKDIEAMVALLLEYQRRGLIIAVRFTGMKTPRAETAEGFAQRLGDVEFTENAFVALSTLLEEAQEARRAVLVVGSLYLASEIYQQLGICKRWKKEGNFSSGAIISQELGFHS